MHAEECRLPTGMSGFLANVYWYNRRKFRLTTDLWFVKTDTSSGGDGRDEGVASDGDSRGRNRETKKQGRMGKVERSLQRNDAVAR